jgi:lipopolysaccharide export system protein LptA
MRRADLRRSGGSIRRACGWAGAAGGLLAVLMISAPATAQKTAKSAAVVPGAAAATGPKTAKPILPGASGKEPINIDAGRLEYFDREQKAVYTGGVVAVQGESRLKTEVLTIFLDRTTSSGAGAAPATGTEPGTASQVRRMEATGGVTITQKDQVGTGDRGSYDKGENKVYLFGNVTLSQGPNVTTGDKLTYDLTSGQAVVEGGRVKSLFVPGSQPEGTNSSKKTKTSPARSRRIGTGRNRHRRPYET